LDLVDLGIREKNKKGEKLDKWKKLTKKDIKAKKN